MTEPREDDEPSQTHSRDGAAAWAVGYNALALPLAAGALAGIGIVVPVWAGAVLMSLSTIIVAINAQTLRARRF
jgi:cation transport ATPase